MNIEDIGKHYISVIVPSAQFTTNVAIDNPNLLYQPFGIVVTQMLSEYMDRNMDSDVPVLFETFRSHARQNHYYNIGSSGIRGGSILNAGMHHFGIAVDIVNLDDKNNNGVRDPGERVDWKNLNYKLFRNMSQKYDLNFLSWEECHFQMIGTNQQKELRVGIYNYVKNWQWQHGLISDGIVGPKTIGKAQALYL